MLLSSGQTVGGFFKGLSRVGYAEFSGFRREVGFRRLVSGSGRYWLNDEKDSQSVICFPKRSKLLIGRNVKIGLGSSA